LLAEHSVWLTLLLGPLIVKFSEYPCSEIYYTSGKCL
jgi:hypothetical protein